MMKIGILREGKVPPDERVALTPAQVKVIADEGAIDIRVKKSEVRRITDEEYTAQGIQVVESVADQDILIGVKEVPIAELIPSKTYFFFSHTIKMQPYNRDLLKAVLDKKIRLIDWECLTDARGNRIIGFGRYAGIVGAYNGFRAYGLRENRFIMKKAHLCEDHDELNQELKKVELPALKILLTGRGKVAKGAMEILDALGIEKVNIEDYLSKQFNQPVYCQITFKDYFKPSDSQIEMTSQHFFEHPDMYESDFMRFAANTDFFIAGHYWDSEAPFLFTRDDAKNPDFNIKYVADISCDIDGPVASTLRPSTIEDPLYGYHPNSESEVAFDDQEAICVMAVDNLPCELPRDASRDFGEMFLKGVYPSLRNGDADGILARATIAEAGDISDQYAYLREWVSD